MEIKKELAVSVISIMFIIFFAFPVGCSSYPTEPQRKLKDQNQHNFIRVCETDALGRPEECSYMHRTVVERDLQEIFGRR